MRQNGDEPFAQLLSRIRVGDCQYNDWKMIATRQPLLIDRDEFKNALRLFSTRQEVDTFNEKRIAMVPRPMATIKAHMKVELRLLKPIRTT